MMEIVVAKSQQICENESWNSNLNPKDPTITDLRFKTFSSHCVVVVLAIFCHHIFKFKRG